MSATSAFSNIAAVVAGLVAGTALGLALGRAHGRVKWRFWAMNAGVLVVGSGLCAVGLALGMRWFALGALGLLAGLLTGVKYGSRGGFLPAQRE